METVDAGSPHQIRNYGKRGTVDYLIHPAFTHNIARDCTAMLVQNETADTSRPDHLKNDPIAIRPHDKCGCLHD
jgi:hypothetical protein